MLGPAIAALALIAAFQHMCGAAALGAKTVPQMPIQHAFGLRQNRQFSARHIAGCRQGTQIFKLPHAFERAEFFGAAHMADIGGKKRFAAAIKP